MALYYVPFTRIEYGFMEIEADTPEDAAFVAKTTFESFNSDKMNNDPSCEVLHRDLKWNSPDDDDDDES